MGTLLIARIVAYAIATVAAAMSYGHQVDLLVSADLGWYAYTVPLTVDLLAITGAVVRNSDVASTGTRRAALVPLILAGSMAVAANVAVANNTVQIVVGVWTVLAYLIAEGFVARLKPAAKPKDAKRIDAGRKAAETRRRNAEASANVTKLRKAPRRISAAA